MKIAREGIPFIGSFLGAGAALVAVGTLLDGGAAALSWTAGAVMLALGVFSLWFFRDPERDIPREKGLVVSPADGTVVAVAESPDGPSVAIFLSVFDVHVNRSPIAGRVESVSYRPGRFLAAFDQRAGEMNERNEIVVTGDEGSVRVRQIAGLIARRIICKVKPGDRLDAGDRFGLIRFGSRTDLRLPPGSSVAVRIGDKVKGGSSVIGRTAARSAAMRVEREPRTAAVPTTSTSAHAASDAAPSLGGGAA